MARSKNPVSFVVEEQLLAIAKRGCSARWDDAADELSPTVDARLEDGSQVNIVIPLIALDGTSISICKFREQNIGILNILIGFRF
ncbi:hypothetical protein OK016_17880 [Vibrio chagasii]|nr:hypothetical protein [Vibrio chagasii]